MKVGVIAHFDSSHYIPGHDKCGSLHGHTYRVEVEVIGEVSNGMVIDFTELKMELNDVLTMFDHRTLNDTIEMPTVENLCRIVKDKLEQRIKKEAHVKIWEGEGKWAEI